MAVLPSSSWLSNILLYNIISADLPVFLGDAVPELPVGDGDDEGGLFSHAGGGEGPGAQDGLDFLLRGHIRLEVPAAPPGLEGEQCRIGHVHFSFLI